MKSLLLFLIFTQILFSCFSQDFGEYIKNNAIETTDFIANSDSIYSVLKEQELIMIGEMHGTNEPAILVKNLSQLILKSEGKVSVGMEIPKDEINLKNKNDIDFNLLNSTFFSKENGFGMNGKAWFDLAKYCLSDSNINLFFFDNYSDDENRDSMMYESIILEKERYPSNKIITLSGNIHNKIFPHNEEKTMGYFCIIDTINFNPNNVCSIKHTYSEGTLMNNTGNGLEFRTINFEEDVFSSSTKKRNYLLFFEARNYPYNGIYYTRQVSHSEKLNE